MMTFADHGIEIPHSAPGPEVVSTCPQYSGERQKKNAKWVSVDLDKQVWHSNHCGWAGGLSEADDRPSEPRHWRLDLNSVTLQLTADSSDCPSKWPENNRLFELNELEFKVHVSCC